MPSAVILAAGLSRRFGSDKLQADMGGETLLTTSVKAILTLAAEIGIIDVFLVLKPCSMFEPLPNLSLVRAARYPDGLSASLRAGVAAIDDDSHAAFIFLADMPFIPTSNLMRRMMAAHAATAADAVRPVWNGMPGHPVLLDRRLFGKVATLEGDCGAREALTGANCVHVAADSDNVVFDIDTPAEMTEARRRYIGS